jgi:hypothetical protein
MNLLNTEYNCEYPHGYLQVLERTRVLAGTHNTREFLTHGSGSSVGTNPYRSKYGFWEHRYSWERI